jgi:hypothetical protein
MKKEIEIKITFDISETSYYTMFERIIKIVKKELRHAYYNNDSDTDSSNSGELI